MTKADNFGLDNASEEMQQDAELERGRQQGALGRERQGKGLRPADNGYSPCRARDESAPAEGTALGKTLQGKLSTVKEQNQASVTGGERAREGTRDDQGVRAGAATSSALGVRRRSLTLLPGAMKAWGRTAKVGNATAPPTSSQQVPIQHQLH